MKRLAKSTMFGDRIVPAGTPIDGLPPKFLAQLRADAVVDDASPSFETAAGPGQGGPGEVVSQAPQADPAPPAPSQSHHPKTSAKKGKR
jgi:hypothetical protein